MAALLAPFAQAKESQPILDRQLFPNCEVPDPPPVCRDPPEQPEQPDQEIPTGSNYAMYQQRGSGEIENPGNRFVICHYHLAQNTIRAQLKQMKNNGQLRLNLPLWHAPYPSPDPDNWIGSDPLCARHYIANSANGDLPPQQLENLANFVQDVAAAGFTQLTIRFNPQGVAHPRDWSRLYRYSADQKTKQLEENWRFIQKVREFADRQAQGSRLRLTYDLGGELPTLLTWNGQRCELSSVPTNWSDVNDRCASVLDTSRYISVVWDKYVARFRSDLRTVGFSSVPTFIQTQIRLMRPSGVLPEEFAVDTYGDGYAKYYDSNNDRNATVYEELRGVANQLKAERLGAATLRIQETNYNDPTTFKEIVDAIKDFGLNVSSINQWWINYAAGTPLVEVPTSTTNLRYRAHPPHSSVLVDEFGFGGPHNRTVWFKGSGIKKGHYVVTLSEPTLSTARVLGHYQVPVTLNMPIQASGKTTGVFRPTSHFEQGLFCEGRYGLYVTLVDPEDGSFSKPFGVRSPACTLPVVVEAGSGCNDQRCIWFSATGMYAGATLITVLPNSEQHYYRTDDQSLNLTTNASGQASGTLRPGTQEEQEALCGSQGLPIAVMDHDIISRLTVVKSQGCR
jgi:hypothetical protein